MTHLRPLLLLALLAASACAQDWPAGSVLCTRNIRESDNTTPPGHINHLAMYLGRGWVVEAQDGYGVIYTRLSDFLARPYRVGVLFPRDPYVGARAAQISATFVGRPYSKLSSLAPLITDPYGMNCVLPIRYGIEGATGRPMVGFRWPNDIVYRSDLFTNRIP